MHSIGYLAGSTFARSPGHWKSSPSNTASAPVSGVFCACCGKQDNITQRELSDLAGTTEATTVRSVNALVKSGFVTRNRCTEDRRKSHIVLTPKARRLRGKTHPAGRGSQRARDAGLEQERHRHRPPRARANPCKPVRRSGEVIVIELPLLPTSLVGSYAQPTWLIDHERLGQRLPPRVLLNELWQVPTRAARRSPERRNHHRAGRSASGRRRHRHRRRNAARKLFEPIRQRARRRGHRQPRRSHRPNRQARAGTPGGWRHFAPRSR